ncbi:hypothetical protein K8I61_12090 [bacterium]|nr:hypothetical protein [bacterium]
MSFRAFRALCGGPFAFVGLGFLLGLAVMLYPGCEGVESDGESITGEFEAEDIPLLPGGFPLYPQTFTSNKAEEVNTQYEEPVDDFYDEILAMIEDPINDELPVGSVDLDEVIPNGVEGKIKNMLEWALGQKVPFFEQGPLTASVNGQIASLFKGAITVKEASLNLEITNDTGDWWAAPVRFSLFVGDAAAVHSKSTDTRAGALVTTDDTPNCNCTFELAPGETKTVTTGNLENLVAALNELNTLALDYDTEVPAEEGDWGGLVDNLKDASLTSVSKWRLTIEKFELNIAGEGSIDIPFDVPDWVKEYADDAL